MSLQALNARLFEEKIYDQGRPCAVIFSRKSCHVCQSVVPILEDMQTAYAGKIEFYYVDVEENKPLFQRFSLKGVPQIMFFDHGEYQGKLGGQVEEEEVEEKLQEVFSI